MNVEIKNNVAVLKLDSPNSKVNVLNLPVMNEVIAAMQQIQSNSAVSSVVVMSGKPGCFIAGADISMIERYVHI